MKQHLDLMRHVRENDARKGDRTGKGTGTGTGTGTLSVFGHPMRFDLEAGFPVLTTKKLHLRSIIHEVLWFLAGDTNVRYPNENGVTIWGEWADERDELGPVYGYQWRSWPAPDGRHIDPLADLVRELKENPDSRRQIVLAWNVAGTERMARPLPTRHMNSDVTDLFSATRASAWRATNRIRGSQHRSRFEPGQRLWRVRIHPG